MTKSTERQQSREETQTPAQRQAAAKLALRKQLEKTLLQVRFTTLMGASQIVIFPFNFFLDSSTETTTTRTSLHPESEQHRVCLFTRIGACRRLHYER